jgi:Flp pilus assembly secretin CpaC
VLTIPNLVRLAVGDAEIADVKTIGGDKVEVTANSVGATTLLAWNNAGQRTSWTVKVSAGASKQSAAAEVATPPPVELWMSPGGQKVLDFKALKRVAVGNPAVVDIKTIGNSELLLVAKGGGTTNVMVWTADGVRHEVKVNVLVTEKR